MKFLEPKSDLLPLREGSQAKVLFVLPVLFMLGLIVIGGQAAQDQESKSVPKPADKKISLSNGIVGSKHDFTSGGKAPRGLCLPCHTPHRTSTDDPKRELEPKKARLRPYRSLGIELDATSVLCLTCHDGSVASDVFTTSHSTADLYPRTDNSPRRGRKFIASHPVGIRYPVGGAKYHPQAAVTADERVKLPGGRIQCVTCHDPHNSGRHEGMLVKSNRRSRLCLSCHRI